MAGLVQVRVVAVELYLVEGFINNLRSCVSGGTGVPGKYGMFSRLGYSPMFVLYATDRASVGGCNGYRFCTPPGAAIAHYLIRRPVFTVSRLVYDNIITPCDSSVEASLTPYVGSRLLNARECVCYATLAILPLLQVSTNL
ncbi:hypothetical protein J6590_010670 [Homalodisca vitripennis]|nr:hypothetical protein J6590_010670 [Homalodisca vitripennis]